MVRSPALIAYFLVTAALTLTGLTACSSPPPDCTTGSCASAEIVRTLTGTSVQNGAAITKMTCKPAKLTAGTWTAACTVTTSDGTVTEGDGNWLLTSNKVTYEPLSIVSGPSS